MEIKISTSVSKLGNQIPTISLLPACSCRKPDRAFGNSSGMPPPQKASMQSTDYLSNGKRARPPGTHSSEVPLRTCSEYAPKDAPRMDASFACSSSEQNISGVSDEPLLRINAKSQAVTGEPFRAGSAPIASAATTPQPAGRSIAYFKGERTGHG